MLSIVLTYFNRPIQLANTLQSFTHSKNKDFNVYIIDNNSIDDIILPNLPFDVTILKLKGHFNDNYIAAHNYGFYTAIEDCHPDKILIQHAEIYHKGDVISYAQTVTDENYYSFSTYSLGFGETVEDAAMNQRANTFDGDSGWYNHPVYRPAMHHFCSAITTNNLIKLNGFDERFCDGVAYDDDSFVEQIKRLGLRIEQPTDPFVFHQWHPIGFNDVDKITRNKVLFDVIKDETDYKAIHILTPDL